MFPRRTLRAAPHASPRRPSAARLQLAAWGRAALVLVLVALGAAPLALPAGAAPALRPPWALTDSLVGYWKLDEASGNRADSAGSNTLTDNNTVTSTTGKISNAGQFTAANSETLSITDNAALSMGDIDFTLSAWVYLDSGGSARRIISKDESGATHREYVLYYDGGGTNQLAFLVWSTGDVIASVNATSYGTLSTGTWAFVVAWHDATANTINIQVNNGTVNSTATSLGVQDSNSAFVIGGRTNGSFWNGRIDEVGVWKRTLSTNERTWLYNAGSGCTHNFAACDATPTPTSTSTSTLTPTVTSTPTSTSTDTPTSTSTVTSTPTETLTPTPGPTSTSTDTPTSTATATAGPSNTPTDTATPGPTDTPTETPTSTATPLVSATPTATITPTPIILIDYTLDSGNHVWIERRATWGDLAVFMALIVLIALNGLRWLYDLAIRLVG